ncbi:MAG: MAPEG family protein [Proteobacteria bacterium]|nr:MAPEG family protein [Pseudomonadota bacterium]
MLKIVPVYAAILALLFLVLSLRVILGRRSNNVGFGSAGSDDLERRIRIHGNFAEYVPFALLLLALAEWRGGYPLILNALCALLLAGRIAHAVFLSRPSTDDIGRVLGMTGTQTAILGAALLLLAG